MRRLALALAALMVMGACSQDPIEPEPTALTVEVEGDLGAPHVDWVGGALPDEPTTFVDQEGTGLDITEASPVLYTVSSFNNGGDLLAGGPTPILGTAATMDVDVVGLREGSRIITVNPQEGGAEVLVLDILHTRAQGESRTTQTSPTVTVGDGGVPAIEGTTKVNRLSTTVLIRGNGSQVGVDDQVYLHYSLYRADDGGLLDSTWDGPPVLLDLEGAFDGLTTGVAETPVGSRLLILVPASEAQGTDDLIVLVDILATS